MTNPKALALIGALALMPAAGAALAQDARPGRYAMNPADGGGFVRLDTLTGEMSLCTRQDERWSCTTMSDDTTKSRGEVDDLKRENTALKAEIKRLDEMLGLGEKAPGALPPGSDAPARPGAPGGPGFRLPTEREVDQALDYFTNILKKFQDRLKRLEEHSPPPSKGTPL